MISSTSCSGRTAAVALAAGLALAACGAQARQQRVATPAGPAAAGPAIAEARPERRGLAIRIALLPPVNASGQPVTLREIQAILEAELRTRGLALASGD